jgi:hypothetical protein
MSWSKEQLKAQLQVLIAAHEFASAPYNDQNDVKGYLTARKRQVRRQIEAAEARED